MTIFGQEKESADIRVDTLIKSGNRQIFRVSRRLPSSPTTKTETMSSRKF